MLTRFALARNTVPSCWSRDRLSPAMIPTSIAAAPTVVERETAEGIERDDARPVVALPQAPQQAGRMADQYVAGETFRQGGRPEIAKIYARLGNVA